MDSETFHLEAWSPRLVEVANSLISKIHVVAPELEVLFMGAAALGLPGKNDIDLDILCDQEYLAKNADKLKPLLGTPKSIDNKLAVWNFVLDGYEIDAILSDPRTSHVPEQRAVFEKLKLEPALLNEYKVLKQTCDGLPYSEYEKRKKDFISKKVLGATK